MDPGPFAPPPLSRPKDGLTNEGKSSTSGPHSVIVLLPTASPSPQPALPFVEILHRLRENETYKEYDTAEFHAMTSEVEDLQQTVKAARKNTRLCLRAVEEQLHSLHRDVSQVIPGVPPPQPLPNFVVTPPDTSSGGAQSGLSSVPPPPPPFVAPSGRFVPRGQSAPPARRGSRRFFGSSK